LTGCNQVRTAIVATFTGAGLSAVSAYDRAAGEVSSPVVSVDIGECAAVPMALGGYLGSSWDERTGTVRELYGRQLELTVEICVRAAAAAPCEAAAEAAADALESGGMPAGIRLLEQTWKAVEWDRTNHCFLRRGGAKCRAYFTASTSEEEPNLLDFILKGVLTS